MNATEIAHAPPRPWYVTPGGESSLGVPFRTRKVWTFTVQHRPDDALVYDGEPGMSDLFHPRVSDEFIARVFAVMAATPQHTYQVLTKRPERMRALLSQPCRRQEAVDANKTWVRQVAGWWNHYDDERGGGMRWPLPNVWVGVSVENQEYADRRIPPLLDTPAAVRFLSCEPLLGPVDLTRVEVVKPRPPHGPGAYQNVLTGHIVGPDDLTDLRVDWVIVGGESGLDARPMHPDWAQKIVDDCQRAEHEADNLNGHRVAVFVKTGRTA